MLEKYNKLIKEWNAKQQEALQELKDCGFVDVLQECKASGNFKKVNDLLKKMEDSPCKAYVKRRLKLDEVSIQDSYENGECPDCFKSIPDDMVEGGECNNCGHVFYKEKE